MFDCLVDFFSSFFLWCSTDNPVSSIAFTLWLCPTFKVFWNHRTLYPKHFPSLEQLYQYVRLSMWNTRNRSEELLACRCARSNHYWSCHLFYVFIDLKKAFDIGTRKFLWKKWQDVGVPSNLLRAFVTIYSLGQNQHFSTSRYIMNHMDYSRMFFFYTSFENFHRWYEKVIRVIWEWTCQSWRLCHHYCMQMISYYWHVMSLVYKNTLTLCQNFVSKIKWSFI